MCMLDAIFRIIHVLLEPQKALRRYRIVYASMKIWIPGRLPDGYQSPDACGKLHAFLMFFEQNCYFRSFSNLGRLFVSISSLSRFQCSNGSNWSFQDGLALEL